MKVTCFRYLAQGKRPALLVGGGEKTKQMGLGDVSIENAEECLMGFFREQSVDLYSNYTTNDPKVKRLSPQVESKQDFFQEFNEWLRMEGANTSTPSWEKIFPDLYIFFFTGCATDKGDLILPCGTGTGPGGSSPSKQGNKQDHHGTDAGSVSGGAAGSQFPSNQIVTLMDIEGAWEKFKQDNLIRVQSYEEYRDSYYGRSRGIGGAGASSAHGVGVSSSTTNSLSAGGGGGSSSSTNNAAAIEKELAAPATAQVSPLLWLILDSDSSNQWVDYAYSRNFRDIVIQGFTDGGTAPLHVVAKAWVQLQEENVDSRIFSQFLKAMGGNWNQPKVYAMPGFKFPPWSVPEFRELFDMLVTGGKKWIFEKKEDAEKEAGYSFHSKDKPVRVYPIQLAQGRRQVLAQSFSILQAEVEEAIGELESVRLLYADGDLRPSKDNRNNVATSLQDKDSNFSGEKLLFILHTLKIYLYTPRVCSAAVRALWALTYNEEVRQDLITPVVIDLLLKVTKLHISDPAICLYATGVVSRCAWNLKIWRSGNTAQILEDTWDRLLQFLLLHPAEEELVRLVGVSLAALSAERGPTIFPTIFPIVCDIIEFYLSHADTLYALLGLILQLIATHVPDSPEDCLRVFALLLQVLEKHPTNAQMTRQCALGFLRLSTNNRAKEVLLSTPQLFTLFLNLLTQSIANFLKRDPYVVWQMISCLLNFLKTHAATTKKLLFVHPKCRLIHDYATEFVEATAQEDGVGGSTEYSEVLKQQVREFLHVFQSEKGLMRQMRINEKRKEKL
mmetsp:Transcript_12516/g.30440  ORF Transcript_12516/g.30440 Transcript_12516/m.30440 type:complete len:784 (-) Transcript_12516:599-2950(-)